MPKIALRLLVLSTLCALVALPASSAIAAPGVTNTNDSGPGSLRAAIEGAAPGETVNVPAGTYTLTSGPLKVEKSLTVAGHAASDTVVRAGTATNLFEITTSKGAVTISGLTIRDGLLVSAAALGAGIISLETNLTLSNVVMTNNRAVADGASGKAGGAALGGGIFYVSEKQRLTIADSSISGNVASSVGGSGKGGGATEGGGVFAVGGLTIERSIFSGNRADARGGQGAPSAEQNGGAALGGGIFAVDGEPTTMSIAASTIDRNFADSSAGPGGSAGATEGGGAFIVSGESPFDMNRLTVALNTGRANGGKGAALGGGLFVVGGTTGSIVFDGATVAANTLEGSSPTYVGGNLFVNSQVKFADTIVSGGIGPAGSENCSQEEPAQSLGFNIDSRDQCNFHAAGDQINTDSLLGPLQNNGGPTETMALASNSPAVDKGAAFGLTSDQRGVQRPIDFPGIANSSAPGADGSDIGAFELQPASQVKLGKLAKNKKRGSAKLTVKVPLPDAGTLTLSGKGLKTQKKTINGSTGTFKFKVVAKGKAKKALRRHGKRKVKIKVTYRPTGNAAAVATRKAKLIKKHG